MTDAASDSTRPETEPATSKHWGNDGEGDTPNYQQARELILLVATTAPGELQKSYQETHPGADFTPFVLQAICVEMLRGFEAHWDHAETVNDALAFIGGMVHGLMFGDATSTLSPPPTNNEPTRRIQQIAQQQGATILEACGVPAVPLAAEVTA